MTRYLYQTLLAATICISCFALGSCKHANADGNEDNVTIVASNRSFAFTSADTVKSTTLKLSCGCAFPITVTSFTGDTTLVSYQFSPALGQNNTTHTLTVTAHPRTSGSHAATLAIYGYDDDANGSKTIYDTLHFTMNF